VGAWSLAIAVSLVVWRVFGSPAALFEACSQFFDLFEGVLHADDSCFVLDGVFDVFWFDSGSSLFFGVEGCCLEYGEA